MAAKNLQERILGKKHRDYARTLEALAKISWKLNDIDLARDYLLEANRINRQLLMQTAGHLSSKELANYPDLVK